MNFVFVVSSLNDTDMGTINKFRKLSLLMNKGFNPGLSLWC